MAINVACSRSAAIKLLQDSRSKSGDMFSLLQRHFIQAGTSTTIADAKPPKSFRVMQWNCLADALAQSSPTSNFIKCPEQALHWSHRRHLILEEILVQDPDILCVEEVDHYHDELYPSLKNVGYNGLFMAKHKSPCLEMPANNGPDGSALFYKENRYDVQKSFCRVLQDRNGAPTSQVLVVAVLYDNIAHAQICCAVAHLKSKKPNKELRREQGEDILKAVSEIGLGEDVPVLICGDFNAEPSEPVYKMMEDSKFISAFKSVLPEKTEPDFTSWKIRPGAELKYTIDYIWHSSAIKALTYLQLPETESLTPDLLPCFRYPSDHVSLAFDFGFADKQ